MKHLLISFLFFIASFSFAQNSRTIDFTKAKAKVLILPSQQKVSGTINYTFNAVQNDTIKIDKRDSEITYFRINNVEWDVDSDQFKKEKILIPIEASVDYQLEMTYKASPKKAMYFLKQGDDWNIWTQGQGKYTSNWLPSFDDVNEKVEFDLTISATEGYEVIANGKLKEKKCVAGFCEWKYDMKKPMSSYLVALAIGKYKKQLETSKSGISLEYYYYPEDSLKVEPTYRYSKEMFDFLEEEIGFAYPWQNYKQVPVHDFLYAGMENTSLTIFSDAYVIDSIGFNDKNYVNVNAHELAHQWFGDLVTAKSGEHHWLQEGFATYYALLAERHIFGKDYFYFKLYESAYNLGRQDISGEGTSLLNPKSSSLTFYQRGAWVLHALRSIVGDEVFREAVVNYLEKHQFANVETSDFMVEVERLYGRSLTDFVSFWIMQKEFPYDQAFELLKKQSPYVNEYMMIDCKVKTSKCAEQLKYNISDDAKVKIISQTPEIVTSDTFKNSLKVRQAISKYVIKIPKAIKEDYETLLEDKSYLTIENALYNLWTNFPEDRATYLSKTRNIVGFNDNNVRLLWLVLNLNTPFYQADNKQGLYEELVSYTDKSYNADLRINAFRYLDLIKSCNDKCLSNLEQAKSHHNWRLVKFAKQMSEQVQQNKK
ncbi:MAG: M1 family metallopeptidase [Winogradskyella sp.]|uniref:M1 family metallopeptidase n=1 Tax=Winogradskyella sp. TaxID=1883156 RepID=UPI00182BC1A5|nr:M1 family metallopeptidase [Winogradskyella sp.]